ncbi:hypothetical protein [Lysobacter solisilvae (ex Woo and Kim 2020)]|uniref:Copper chaperone n=1 Tax=Agrilutibacter terrestris TaxID=2865112 RepID=A0A7H0FWL3_9GAMM|nr:hypothetical protein [Lysobacter terrestris]QNP40429.1 hypothetical protein H8B22_13270 [Lysobacter terrestris]
MEFRYHVPSHPFDLPAIERAIAALDPAAVLDADAPARIVRISTSLDDEQLLACLRQAGIPVTAAEIERLPSVCCGGCGG